MVFVEKLCFTCFNQFHSNIKNFPEFIMSKFNFMLLRESLSIYFRKGNVFPDETTPTTLFFGIPYSEIPIVHIKTSPNNTTLIITNAKGTPQINRSCGMEGFKNTRKGTNIAAQATAITLSGKILERGIKVVRVAVRGLGPGRMVNNLITWSYFYYNCHIFSRLSKAYRWVDWISYR